VLPSLLSDGLSPLKEAAKVVGPQLNDALPPLSFTDASLPSLEAA
jgi:hypothetical protein